MNASRYLKIGAFFLSLGVAGSAYVITAGDGFNGWNTKIYEIEIADATGLTTNSKVYLAGVPVGKIREIDLETNSALLKVAFLKDMQIRQDAHVTRQSSSLLGTSILTLTPGTELTPLVNPGGRINAAGDGASMTGALGSVRELSDEMIKVLKELQENQLQLLAVSLETFNSISRKFDERTNAELDRVSRILEASARITERFDILLREKEGDLGTSASEARLALENLRQITDEIRSGQGNVGQALYDDRLYASLLATASKTEEAAAKLNTTLESANLLAVNANSVVVSAGNIVDKANGLGVQVDANTSWSLLSNQGRAGASLVLEPRSQDRWYRLGLNSAPEGIASRTVTESKSGSTLERTDTTLTEYKFSIDAELARRLGPFTLRSGLLR
ncbi:hypothetical protein MASR2M78_13970 [Treponema sp.]